MNTPRVNLFVLRVADIDRSAAFYRLVGFQFSKHAHGMVAVRDSSHEGIADENRDDTPAPAAR
jgi:hypothetical protein